MPDESSYSRYPEYKDSGVEWLGEIPEGWGVRKIKWISTVKRGASPRPIGDPIYFDDKGEYGWVRIEDVTASGQYLYQTKQKLSDSGKSLSVPLEPGALFLSIAGSVGKPIITKIKCCIHDGFVYFDGLKLHAKFLYYIFAAGTAYQGLGKLGTQLNLNTETIGDIFTPLPPKPTQQRIANFLDSQTAKIDKLLGINDRKIELLKEYRKAVISHAVTKGLDSNARMKDSGVEWQGKIPEEWELKKLGVLGKLAASGIDKKTVDSQTWVKMVNYTDVYGNHNREIREDVEYMTTTAPADKVKECVLKKGDILFTPSSETIEEIGESAVVMEDLSDTVFSYHLIRFRPEQDFNINFLKYICGNNFVLQQFSYRARGTIRMTLNRIDFKETYVVIPPKKIQHHIANFLDEKTKTIDSEIQQIQKQNELLTEYRQSLISNAVTGKIMV